MLCFIFYVKSKVNRYVLTKAFKNTHRQTKVDQRVTRAYVFITAVFVYHFFVHMLPDLTKFEMDCDLNFINLQYFKQIKTYC